MKLQDIPKNDEIFSVPEGYFDALSDSIARRIRNDRHASTAKKPILKAVYRVAAAVTIAFAATAIAYRAVTPDYQSDASPLSVEEILFEQDISETELLDFYLAQTDENTDFTAEDEILFEFLDTDTEDLTD